MLKEKYSNNMSQRSVTSFEFVPAHGSRPGQAIVDAALKQQSTLIVTGSRGLSSTRRTLVGSVSDYILHNAHCPVLICRDPTSNSAPKLGVLQTISD